LGHRAGEAIRSPVILLMPEPDLSRPDDHVRRHLEAGERRTAEGRGARWFQDRHRFFASAESDGMGIGLAIRCGIVAGHGGAPVAREHAARHPVPLRLTPAALGRAAR
jgi:hypothetical protein